MNRRQFAKNLIAGASLSMLPLGARSRAFAGQNDEAAVRRAIDEAIQPVIARYGIPGLAVGVTVGGVRHFAEYGLAAKKPQAPVTRDTLFELGSISKTFTATLACSAEIDGKLALTDSVGRHMAELKGTPVGDLQLLDLATHTTGRFPLQLPAEVTTKDELMDYYRAWKPRYTANTRTYANPSIALLGIITARAMGERFETLAEGRLFPALGLQRTYIDVPAAEMATYAWGTNGAGKAVRVAPSPITTEAYGVKSNTIDMLRFLEVNMGIGDVSDEIARAVVATHTGYFHTGPFIQDLIWEEYPSPVALDDMMTGNSAKISQQAVPATAIVPPMPPRSDALLNKTGSTGGFGAYVAFIPAKTFGIVMLANKFYPNEVRTKAAYQVMARLVG